MRAQDKKARLEQFEQACRQQGLPRTVQRRAILEAILGRDDHPTADAVYESVRDRIPGMSRTTVYRALETLVRLGVITKVCHPGTAARFDPKIHQHHHLICLRCDCIVDLEDRRLNEIPIPKVETQGFDVREFHVHFRGLCPQCQKDGRAGGRRPIRRSDRTASRTTKQRTKASTRSRRRNKT